MVFRLAASDGKKMPLVFIKNGVRINTDVYLNVLIRHIKPRLKANYPLGNYVIQQDSAPSQKA
jgi:hypothetical protein